jgi:hypothetical protein
MCMIAHLVVGARLAYLLALGLHIKLFPSLSELELRAKKL